MNIKSLLLGSAAALAVVSGAQAADAIVAAAPEGQTADGETSEAASVAWQTPEEALTDWRAGKTILLPPTWTQLTSLAQFGSVAEALAAEPEIPVILPTLYQEDGQLRVRFPGQDPYYEAVIHPWSKR